MSKHKFLVAVAVAIGVAAGIPGSHRAAAQPGDHGGPGEHGGGKEPPGKPEVVELNLTPSSAQLAACMPDARVDVTVRLTTDLRGFDVFHVQATGLPPNTTFTVFLLEQAGAPFGGEMPEGYLTSIPTTIFSGSNEIQRNVIATRGLGLPRG